LAKYIVTGGAGFIGSAVVRELVRRGERVRVIDSLLTGHRHNIAGFIPADDFIEMDIREEHRLSQVMRGADYIIHLAALPSVPRSIEDPLSTNLINTHGTLNVLVAARQAGVKRVVYAASSSAYGDTPELPKGEWMKPHPLSPYGASKLAGENYCQTFTQVYGLETVCLRYFNVFGPRQDPSSPYSGVLSRFMTALLHGERPVVFGDGEQSRDFTFVEDVVNANLLASKAPCVAGRVINIATGTPLTLNQTLKILSQLSGESLNPIYKPARAGDIRHSHADIRLAQQLLAYSPRVSFEVGLRSTLEWYRRREDKKVRAFPEIVWNESAKVAVA
jgi:nucleoside-diphosphate-sugar epimerase